MRLRVIDSGHIPPHDCEAVYHGLAAAMQPEDDAILSLAGPDETYVSVGRFQVVAQEIDRARCRTRHFPVIRRQLGGGVGFVDRNRTNIHFIQPHHRVAVPMADLYARFLEPVVRTCGALGIAAEFSPISELYVGDRRIGGADAGRIGESVVVACNLNAELDLAAIASCLQAPSDAFRDKLREMMADEVTSLLHELHIMPPREEFRRILLKECGDCLGAELVEDAPTEAERAAIAEWADQLADESWTLAMDRKVTRTDAAAVGATVPADATHVTAGGLISVHLLEREGAIAELVLSGAFSCLPGDGLETLCHRLVGEPLDEASLSAEAARTMQDIGIEMPGIVPADLAAAIMAAHRE